jgi:hypothetical protein
MLFRAAPMLLTDIRSIIQRLLILGIPMLPASCSRGALDGTGGAGAGGWGGAAVAGMSGGFGGMSGGDGFDGGFAGFGGGGSGGDGTGFAGFGGGGSGGGGTGGTGGSGGSGGTGGSREVGSCVGGWGADAMNGLGCRSGPYQYDKSEYRLLDGMDAQQMQRYLACAQDLDCANFAEICQGMLAQRYPVNTTFVMENATLTSCDPACKAPGQPGVHMTFHVTGGCEGRRPAGLAAESELRSGHPAGLLFAAAGRLEAASVPAFAHLARELRAHGAPLVLVDGALQARRDEVRHTRQMRALARRFGTVPVNARVRPTGLRSLEVVATENAVEGCVRETYGALVAWWQAIHSDDAVVRTTMRQVAADETRHAALAHEIHQWAIDRLSAENRRSVDQARANAFDDLSEEVSHAEVPEPAIRAGGYPSKAAAKWLVDNLRRELT